MYNSGCLKVSILALCTYARNDDSEKPTRWRERGKRWNRDTSVNRPLVFFFARRKLNCRWYSERARSSYLGSGTYFEKKKEKERRVTAGRGEGIRERAELNLSFCTLTFRGSRASIGPAFGRDIYPFVRRGIVPCPYRRVRQSPWIRTCRWATKFWQ